MGGELVRAERPSWMTPADPSLVIAAFPTNLNSEYRAGLVVTELPPSSPLAKAGIQESDLILSLNGEPVEKVKEFRRTVEATAPGTPVKLVVFRSGELSERTAVVGKETYRQMGNISMGLALSPHLEFDLLPNPDFSLVALGYKRNEERVQLDSTQRNYIRSVKGETAETGVPSEEGWRAWLAIFSVSDTKQILSQETAEATASK